MCRSNLRLTCSQGLTTCTERDMSLWQADRYKFPPYQYRYEHGLCHRKKGWQVPGVNVRESILGLPSDYTMKCWSKQAVKSDPMGHEDARLTQLGNGWGVQMAAFLMKNLCQPRGLCQPLSLQSMLRRCQPGSNGMAYRCKLTSFDPPGRPVGKLWKDPILPSWCLGLAIWYPTKEVM